MSKEVATINHGGHQLSLNVKLLQKIVLRKNKGKVGNEPISRKAFLEFVSSTKFDRRVLTPAVEKIDGKDFNKGDKLPDDFDFSDFGKSVAGQLPEDEQAANVFFAHKLIKAENVADPKDDSQDVEGIKKAIETGIENVNLKEHGNLLAKALLIIAYNDKAIDTNFGGDKKAFQEFDVKVDKLILGAVAKLTPDEVNENHQEFLTRARLLIEFAKNGCTVEIGDGKQECKQLYFDGKDELVTAYDQTLSKLEEIVKAKRMGSSEGTSTGETSQSGNGEASGTGGAQSSTETHDDDKKSQWGKYLGIGSIVVGALAALGGIFSSEEGTRGKAVSALVGMALILLPFLKPFYNKFWGSKQTEETA